jgi:hypothetical protein
MNDSDKHECGDARPELKGIDGYRDWPKPKKATWPDRFRRIKRVRSERRRRAHPFSLETKIERGSVTFIGWRGADKRVRSGLSKRRPWGSLRRPRGRRRITHPPYRTISREQGMKLQSATKEETAQMIRDAWDTLMGLREGRGIDPEVWWSIQRQTGPIHPDG